MVKKKSRKIPLYKIVKLPQKEFKKMEHDLDKIERKLEPVKKKGFMACKRKKKRRK